MREHLDQIATERAEMYRCRPHEGVRVTILVMPAEVEYGVPEEAEVAQAVQGLKGGIEVVLSGMRVEYLKRWFQEASREKNPVKHWWRLLVRLIQRKFEDGFV